MRTTLTLLSLCVCVALAAQKDCADAQLLTGFCTITIPLNDGVGVPENVGACSCLSGDERASHWFTFTCTAGGTLVFQATPLLLNTDYDVALFANGCPCDLGQMVDCNFSGANPGISVTLETGITYYLLVDNYTQNTSGFTLELSGDAEIGSTPAPVSITSNSPLACPPDSTNTCQKVCANSTVTYEVADLDASAQVSWSVDGAEEFTANGNALEVQWGAPGEGEVAAMVSGEWVESFQIFATHSSNAGGDDTPVSAIYRVVIIGGTPPYHVIVKRLDGVTVSSGNTSSTTYYNGPLGNGIYQAIVTDASGATAEDWFATNLSNTGCYFNVIPSITHATGCNSSDGSIQFVQSGGTGPFSYEWSIGATTSGISGFPSGIYQVTITNGCSQEEVASFEIACPQPTCYAPASLCVQIRQDPQAQLAATPAPAASGVIEICQGQEVLFQNTSDFATSYVWNFGDGNTSTQFEPGHAYLFPGTFTAALIARNDCFCADTAFVTVHVLPAASPQIDCIGSVCEGETVTYTSGSDCGSYTWSVSGNASVIGGGGAGDDFITVDWLTGPEGSISLQTDGCGGAAECNVPNVMPIAIMSDNAEIQGLDKVCDGAVVEYFIPDFLGADITWQVTAAGTILSPSGAGGGGQGTNRIAVRWTAGLPNPQQVIVFFENCFLGCAGQDTLLVSVKNDFFAEGGIEFCQNVPGAFSSRNAVTGALTPSNWQVMDAAGTPVWTSPGAVNSVNIFLNFPAGNYTVRATSPSATAFCNDEYDIFIHVFGNPPPAGGIGGETQICPGETYTYTALGVGQSGLEWSIENGGILTTASGNPVNVTWGPDEPHSLLVTQVSTNGLFCTSQPSVLGVSLLPTVSISGEGQACVDAAETYSATIVTLEGSDYQWIVTPDNAGTITAGQGTPNVTVLWHAVGTAELGLSVCNSPVTFTVNVLAKPTPFVPGAEVCAGQMAMVATSEVFSNYVWKNPAGATVSILQNPTLGAGNYVVVVTDGNGCTGNANFEIAQHPKPAVHLSAPIYLGLCPGGPPATIHATTEVGGLDYQWFLNNNPIGTNATTYSTTDIGTYRVDVTDQHGCTTSSDFYLLGDCELLGGECVNGLCTEPPGGGSGGPGGGGVCTLGGSMNFDIQPTANCATHQYQNASVNFTPGSLLWLFDDGGTSTQTNPSHTFAHPGFYAVVLRGKVLNLTPLPADCEAGIMLQDTILAVANFEATNGCPGAPVQFDDRTEHMEFADLTAWAWNFGEPSSGAANVSNQQHPSHTYAAPGTYPVSLTVTVEGGCQTSISRNVTVHPLPTVSFTPPAGGCENKAFDFSATVTGGVTSYAWNFGDPASTSANLSTNTAPSHIFNTPGTYMVSVSVENAYGCPAGFFAPVNVTSNTLTGDISMSKPSPICPGDSIVLTANSSGAAAYLWSTGSTDNHLTIQQSAIYKVTLTDANGCTFTPPPAVVDVFGEPNALVQAVEYNEYGQPGAIFQNNYAACEGEDVHLQVVGQPGYTYSWSNGSTDLVLEFTEDKDNLLVTGNYVFNVTVTDVTTGCTGVEGITVDVHPAPEVEIASNPSGFLCENTQATLFVTSPEPSVSYTWNTGEPGTSIPVVAGGRYFAVAVNAEGCSARSNEIDIQNAPGANKFPLGCLTRCAPAEICLPDLPEVVAFQWYLDGSLLSPAEGGNLPSPSFTQSGDYQVEMTDLYGCTSLSGTLSLTLLTGYGTLGGEVFFDVNENGVIDPADTTVSGVNFFLTNGGTTLETATSNPDGNYAFANILSNNYSLVLDTLNLPPGWSAILTTQNQELTGCDDADSTNWLLFFTCLPTSSSLELAACQGGSAMYGGTPVPAGTSQTFPLTNADGCDSLVTVSVAELPHTVSSMSEAACGNSFFEFQGQQIPAGETAIFTQINAAGCLDTTLVSVAILPGSTGTEHLSACPGGTVDYLGVPLQPGETAVVTFENWQGCDSVVTVMVGELATSTGSLQLQTCEGSTVEFQGQQLAPGDVTTWVTGNWLGCDSVVTVSVVAVAPPDTTHLLLLACLGETSVVLNGETIAIGESALFHFPDQTGCDSVVLVTVGQAPVVDYWMTTGGAICADSNNGFIHFWDHVGATAPYEFSIDGGQTFQEDHLFGGLAGGHYDLQVRDQSGCLFFDEIEIPVFPKLVVQVPDFSIACGDSTRLTFSVAPNPLPYTWLWQGSFTDSVFWVSAPDTYTLRVSNACETVEHSLEVAFEDEPPLSQIYLPNSFSPNEDGINDCFRGYISPDLQLLDYQLLVFDRWGNKMFGTEDIGGCWDGRFRDRAMDPAVFVWFIKMRVLDCEGVEREVFREGGVTIVK